jgi:predicted nucleic acid-binding Zn ribbon protein
MENQQKQRKPALQIALVLILVVILGVYILAQ